MRVPTYDNFQEAPGGGPSPNVSGNVAPNTAGLQAQQLGEGLQHAGSVVGQIANDIQRNINEARVKERDNNLSEAMRKALSDPGGYLTKLGKDAIDGHEEVVKSLRKQTEDLSEGLENDAQRRMFTDAAQRRLQSALGQIGSHAAQQTKVYASGQASARAESAAKDMVANWVDPKMRDAAKQTMLSEVGKVGELQGLSPEEIEKAKGEALSAAHTGVVSHLLSSEDGYKDAKAYFGEHRSEIEREQADRIATRLKSEGVRDASLQRFLKMQKMSYPAQLAKLDADARDNKISAEEYDATMSRIDHAEGQRARRESEVKEAQLGAAHDWILRNPGQPVVDMPMYAWAMENGQLPSLQNFARSGADPITDTGVYLSLRDMAVDPARQAEFAKLPLEQFRGSLSRSDFNAIVNLKAAVNTQNVKEMETAATVARAVKLVQEQMVMAGVDPTPGDNKMANERLGQFKVALTRAVESKIKAAGKPLTDEEVRKVGLDMLKQGVLQGTGFLGMFEQTPRRFEVTPDQQAATPFVGTPFKQIPATDVSKIEAYLLMKNIPKEVLEKMSPEEKAKEKAQRDELMRFFGLRPNPLDANQLDRGNANFQRAIEQMYEDGVN